MPDIKEHRDRIIWLWQAEFAPKHWDASLSTGIINAHPYNDIQVLVQNKNNRNVHPNIYSHEGGIVKFNTGDFIFVRMTPDTLVGYGTVREVFPQARWVNPEHPLCAVDWKLSGEWPVTFKANVPVQLVRILKFQGQYPEALNLAVNILDKDPGNLAVKLERISILGQLGHWSTAGKEIQPILVKHPAHTGVLRQYANILQQEGEAKKAVSIYKEILDTHPGNHHIRGDLAALLRKMHQWDAAKDHLDTILESDPENLRALKELSLLYRITGDFEKCIATDKIILAHHPSDINARCSLTQTLLKIERLDEAGLILADLMQRAPAHPVVQRTHATYLAKTKKTDDAIAVLDRCHAYNPDDLPTRVLLMNILADAGAFERAEKIADGILSMDPLSIRALHIKIWLMESMGHSRKAMTFLNSKASNHIDKTLVYIVRQEFLSRHYGTVTALKRITEICEKQPTKVEALKAGATIARIAGRRDLSSQFAEQALKYDPANSPMALQLASDYAHLYLFDEAVKTLDRIQPIDPMSCMRAVKKILLKASGAKIPESMDVLCEKAFALHLSGDRLNQNSQALISAGLASHIIPYLEKIIEKDPGGISMRIMPMWAYALFESGHNEKASQLIDDYNFQGNSYKAHKEVLHILRALGRNDRLSVLFSEFIHSIEENLFILKDKEMEAMLQFAWSTGHSDLMHRLYNAAVKSPLQSKPNIVNQAERILQDGQQSSANQCIAQYDDNLTNEEKDSWYLKKAIVLGMENDALHYIKKRRVSQGGLTLDEAQDHIKVLLRKEAIDEAGSHLDKYLQQFPKRDLVIFKAQVMRQNLEIENAIEYLASCHLKDPFDERIAHELVTNFLNSPNPEKAQQIIRQWTVRRPMSPKWKLAEIKYCWQTSKDRDELVALVHRILSENPPELNIHFYISAEEALRSTRQFDLSYRMLEKFNQAIQTLPSDMPTRLLRKLSHAAHLRMHGRFEEVRTALSHLDNSIYNFTFKNNLYVVKKDNDGCAGVDWQIVQDHVNQISTPRHRYTFTDFTSDFKRPAPHLSVIVLAHIYYTDLWTEIRPYLEEMSKTGAKICISLSEHSASNGFEDFIRKDIPDALITYVSNRGFDVGAHWQVIEKTDLSQYEVVVLVQTKKAGHTGIGDHWRRNLLNAVAGTSARWSENLWAFKEDKTVGIIGSGRHRNSADGWDYKEMRDVLVSLDMPTRFDALKSIYEHVSGTIFMIRASLLKELFEKTNNKFSFERYEDLCLGKLRDRTYAHAMERVFGMYPNWKGYKTLWRP